MCYSGRFHGGAERSQWSIERQNPCRPRFAQRPEGKTESFIDRWVTGGIGAFLFTGRIGVFLFTGRVDVFLFTGRIGVFLFTGRIGVFLFTGRIVVFLSSDLKLKQVFAFLQTGHTVQNYLKRQDRCLSLLWYKDKKGVYLVPNRYTGVWLVAFR